MISEEKANKITKEFTKYPVSKRWDMAMHANSLLKKEIGNGFEFIDYNDFDGADNAIISFPVEMPDGFMAMAIIRG